MHSAVPRWRHHPTLYLMSASPQMVALYCTLDKCGALLAFIVWVISLDACRYQVVSARGFRNRTRCLSPSASPPKAQLPDAAATTDSGADGGGGRLRCPSGASVLAGEWRWSLFLRRCRLRLVPRRVWQLAVAPLPCRRLLPAPPANPAPLCLCFAER